jgi:hypothetical protein
MNKLVVISLTALTLLSLGSCKKAEETKPEAETPLKEFKQNNWLIEADGTLFLTSEGRLKADYIASELFV